MDKTKAIDAAVSQIERQFGKGSIMRMGDEERPRVASIPTGALALDLALGVGGVPRGRIVEIFGPESSGKTTLALHMIAEAQKAGGLAAFIDAEHALDPTYAQAIGVDLENLYFSQPDNGEQALEIADTLVRSGALDVVVIDSVAALVPRAEIEGEMGDSHVGLQARLMSQALQEAFRVAQPFGDDGHLHQPAQGEDRGHVRLSGDDAWREGAEVLLQRASRHQAHRGAKGRH